MKKIVIVGHPQSGYQDVEALLNACGMTAARPSRREGFSPVEIGSILTRSHAIPATGQLDDSQAIEQIEPSPVWHGMALDLMLGNLDQDVWGWADPQAISLLNYWRDLDPQITFMLVYDKPHSVLTRLSPSETANLTADRLRELASHWVAYNAALLHFFHRNSQRCLLVHSEQVSGSVSSCLHQVRARIGAPWSERMDQLVAPKYGSSVSHYDNVHQMTSHGTSSSNDELKTSETSAVTEKQPAPMSSENPLTLFLAEALLQQNPRGLQMYQELQAAASLPLSETASAAHTPLKAWLAMVVQAQALSAAERLLNEKERQIENLSHSQDITEQLEAIKRQRAAENEQAKTQASQLRAELRAAEAKAAAVSSPVIVNCNPALEQENELLLAQLHQVQEELERVYLKNRAVNSEVAQFPISSVSVQINPVCYGAAARIKQQLSYRLGAIMVQRSRSLIGCLGMPFALAREVKQFKNEAPERSAKKLPPIHQYQDLHEAEKVKRHLSYLLGNALVIHARSPIGLAKLPWILARAVIDFRKRKSASPGEPQLRQTIAS